MVRKSNPYFPCTFIEHDDCFSVVCSRFQYFDDHFGGREAGGYTVERLAKKLAKEHGIAGVKFDSEAGMFCAYSNHKGALRMLCTQLRKITGGEKRHLPSQKNGPSIPLDEAERLLLKGFVLSLDKKAQLRFVKQVPCPELSKQQAEHVRLIREGTDVEVIKAARRINSEARTLTRKWDHYLSHPDITGLLMECCDANHDNPRVLEELMGALVFICDRHLPDLRAESYFIACLKSKRQRMRTLGIWGLDELGVLTDDQLRPLLDDRSSTVRKEAERKLRTRSKRRQVNYPSWMFDPANAKSVS